MRTKPQSTLPPRARYLDPDVARRVAPLAAAILLVGASFGAIADAAGVPLWLSVAMSVLVFAGGSQFAAVAMTASGGNPLVAAVAGILLNARHLPFGLAVGDVVGRGWFDRLVGSHLMIDESVAFALAETDQRRRRITYWTVGVSLFIAWNVGVPLGAYAGNRLGDPSTWGLDAAFPAALLALLVPSLKHPRARVVALGGAGVALATTPVLPNGIPVLVAMAAVPLAALVRRPSSDQEEPDHSPPGPASQDDREPSKVVEPSKEFQP